MITYRAYLPGRTTYLSIQFFLVFSLFSLWVSLLIFLLFFPSAWVPVHLLHRPSFSPVNISTQKEILLEWSWPAFVHSASTSSPVLVIKFIRNVSSAILPASSVKKKWHRSAQDFTISMRTTWHNFINSYHYSTICCHHVCLVRSSVISFWLMKPAV